MYVYLITNLVNNKKYVGITNNYKKRWANHKCNNNPTMAIAKAIQKYGVDNFKFELLEENIPLEEVDEKEQYYIEKLETHVSTGKGYNISKGGRYNIENSAHVGTENGKALLTEEEVKYIKSHRNIPEYVLYEEFSEKISYETFKKVYLDLTYKNIKPTSDVYPNNRAFSCQFTSSKLTYDQVVELRNKFNNQIFWREAYTSEYKEIFPDELCFWNVYMGNRYKLVMPEVFTKENVHYQASVSHSGENNGRAKLTWKKVEEMRKLYESKQKTKKELYEMYSEVSTSTINRVLNYRAWVI